MSYEIRVLNDPEKSLTCVSTRRSHKGRGAGIGGLKRGEIITINCGRFRTGNNIQVKTLIFYTNCGYEHDKTRHVVTKTLIND